MGFSIETKAVIEVTIVISIPRSYIEGLRYHAEQRLMIGPINYNEYKYLVTNQNLPYVHQLLEATYGHSDPFQVGTVDSIYFDTLDKKYYNQCFNGDPQKNKVRIRGYGDDRYVQFHLKMKDVFIVDKIKKKIVPIHYKHGTNLSIDQLKPLDSEDTSWQPLISHLCSESDLVPAVRVRYKRYRYRVYDFRVTLDTNIEIMGFSSDINNAWDYAMIPYHVLEVKTREERPFLPLFGLMKLPQISFSKFFLGLNLLRTGSIAVS